MAEAFAVAENFTSGHETLSQAHPDARFDYPDQHVEADNRLAWFLGELDRRFGDDTHYVHLRRDPEAVARSYAARWPAHRMQHEAGIMGAYAHGVFQQHEWPARERLDLARSYVSTVTANIELFLRGRPNVHRADLETLPDDIVRIWDAIGAEGDRERARAIAAEHHNVGLGPPTLPQQTHQLLQRWYGYSRSIASHLRDARRTG